MAPSHSLNQCWNIDYCTLRNKLHWKFDWNSNTVIDEKRLKMSFCEMTAILSRPQCIKNMHHKEAYSKGYATISFIPGKLPWIFPGAPLEVTGAPGNIQGNLTALLFLYHLPIYMYLSYSSWCVCLFSVMMPSLESSFVHSCACFL